MKRSMVAMLLAAILILTRCALSQDDVDAQKQGGWETIKAALEKNKPAGLKEMKLRLGEAKHDLSIQYHLQQEQSPLVVIINGTFGRALNVYSNDVARSYICANCSVLTFDSFFTDTFLSETEMAAPGNLQAEAALAGKIVQAFLEQPETKDHVSEISVVGMSYGGGVALQMALLDNANALPFKLARVQALSVPISFRDSIKLIDTYADQQSNSILPIVWAALQGKAMPENASLSDLEKVIGCGFRLELPKTAKKVDELFIDPVKRARMRQLDLVRDPNSKLDAIDTNVEACAASFQTLFESRLVPYWQDAGQVKSADELMDFGELSKILPMLGSNVQIVIARNDPLNEQGAINKIKAIPTSAHLTILDSGGHLGYVRSEPLVPLAINIFSRPSFAY